MRNWNQRGHRIRPNPSSDTDPNPVPGSSLARLSPPLPLQTAQIRYLVTLDYCSSYCRSQRQAPFLLNPRIALESQKNLIVQSAYKLKIATEPSLAFPAEDKDGIAGKVRKRRARAPSIVSQWSPIVSLYPRPCVNCIAGQKMHVFAMPAILKTLLWPITAHHSLIQIESGFFLPPLWIISHDWIISTEAFMRSYYVLRLSSIF